MKRIFRRGYSIQTQMIFSFILLVVLTAVAVGFPSIQVMRNEFARQAQAQTDRGRNIAQVVLSSMQNDLNQSAMLIAQRPTLAGIIAARDLPRLTEYLEVLRTGAGLDLLVVCDPNDKPMGSAGPTLAGEFCQPDHQNGIVIEQQTEHPVWWISSLPFPDPIAPLGNVVVGRAMDSSLAVELRSLTGMEQIFLLDGRPIAGTLGDLSPEDTITQIDQDSFQNITSVSGLVTLWYGQIPYHSTRFSFGDPEFEIVTALPIADLIQTERQLTRTIALSILAITGVGSLLGILVARTLSQPLERLEDAAVALRMGDLSTPVPGMISFREVNSVARALDDARMTLEHTLHELRIEKEWIEHLLESIVEGIITLDLRGRVTYFSAGAERILGIKPDDALYRSCDEIFRLAEGNGPFSQYLPSPSQRRKVPVRLRDGRHVVLSISGARFSPPEAGKGQVALVLRDVSDEESLRRLLGDFLANITHEFRTPLSALAASVELLMENLPDLSQQELLELLNSIHLGVIGLQTLIDNLLEGASIEAGQFRVFPSPVDISRVLNEAVDTLQPLVTKHGQSISLETPANLPLVIADPRRTSQVVINLLSNAIKNTPQGGKILLKAKPEIDFVRVEIEDEGPGIPQEYLPDLFVRFVRFDTGDHYKPGAGLGLSVVKAIIEAQGGNVGAGNRPQGGASFWFTVPAQTERSAA